MVFKNGELLRFYYDHVDLDETGDTEIDVDFGDSVDRNDLNPDKNQSTIGGPIMVGGGEVLELCEIDLSLDLGAQNAYSIHLYKIDERGITYNILTLTGLTASYVHIDRTDLESRIDRSVPIGSKNGYDWDAGDWRITVSMDDGITLLSNDLDVSWVVRVH